MVLKDLSRDSTCSRSLNRKLGKSAETNLKYIQPIRGRSTGNLGSETENLLRSKHENCFC
jgi:hypothetical protein